MMADAAALMKQNIKLRGKSFSLVRARQAKGLLALIATFAPEKRGSNEKINKSPLRKKFLKK